MNENLMSWVIYNSPSDHPGKFVARKFNLDIPTSEHKTADTLDDIRKLVSPGLVCLKRSENDDPVIVEVWL